MKEELRSGENRILGFEHVTEWVLDDFYPGVKLLSEAHPVGMAAQFLIINSELVDTQNKGFSSSDMWFVITKANLPSRELIVNTKAPVVIEGRTVNQVIMDKGEVNYLFYFDAK